MQIVEELPESVTADIDVSLRTEGQHWLFQARREAHRTCSLAEPF